MPLSAADLALVRSHVGTQEPPTDAQLDDSYDALGSVAAVALEVLRGRLGALTSRPAKLAIDGDVSVDWSKTIELLSAKVDALAAAVDVEVADGAEAAPLVWAGGVYKEDAADRDPALVDPYFTEGMLTQAEERARSG